MTRRILNLNTGDSTRFGSIDGVDYINKLLTAVDQTSTDPVDINTQWTYRSSKLRIANPANTFYYTVAGSAITANRILTLPLLTADDILVTEALPQTLNNKTIDYSSNTSMQGVVPSPDKKIVGFFSSASTSTGHGIFAGNLTQVSGAVTVNTTDGRYCRYTTTTTSGNDAGIRVSSSNSSIIRGKNCRFKCRFRFAPTGTSTAARLFVGLSTLTTLLNQGDNPLNATAGIGVSVVTTNGNFRIAHNDNASTAVFETIGAGTAIDSNSHTIEIQADQTNSGFKYSWDGGAFSSLITSDIPAQDDLLNVNVWVETNEAAAKSVDIWYFIGEQDP